MNKQALSRFIVPPTSAPQSHNTTGVPPPHVKIICGNTKTMLAWSRSDLFTKDYEAACALLHAELVRNGTIMSPGGYPSGTKIFVKFAGDREWMLLPPSQWKEIGQYADELKVEHPGIPDPYAYMWERD